jgi:uncharacterized protein (TIGR02466 family)
MKLIFDPQRDIRQAFATPIAHIRVADGPTINPGLKRIIAEREVMDPTLGKSNIGGWHSDGTLLEWPAPEIPALIEIIKVSVIRMIAEVSGLPSMSAELGLAAWANVSRNGAYNGLHNHPRCHWSGVYYVDIGDDNPDWPDSGVLEFIDPRGSINIFPNPHVPFGQPLKVTPRESSLILFPAWLLHQVHPYHGARDRISIAFNANLKKTGQGNGDGRPDEH